MNQNCPQELLTLYHYDELPVAQRQEFEAHLRECPECRAALAELRSGLQGIPVPELRLDPAQKLQFTERVLRKTRRSYRPLAAWGGALAAAGALALAVVVLQPDGKLPVAPGSPELADYEILEQLDLLQDLDLLQELELLEELEQLG